MSLKDFAEGVKIFPSNIGDVEGLDDRTIEAITGPDATLAAKTVLAQRILELPPAQQRKALALLERVTAARVHIPRIKRPFRDYIMAGKPEFQWLEVHSWFEEQIVYPLIKGVIQNVMINAPPRVGKSEIFSRFLPGYLLEVDPTWWCALSSYGAELAESLSREARDYYMAAGNLCRKDVARSEYWMTAAGGGMWSTGVGGRATGKGANWLFCDDPVKDKADADSEVISEKNWAWWRSTWRTRRHPRGTRKILVMTRWAKRDVGGRVLETITETSEPWHLAILPQELYPDPVKFRARYPKFARMIPDFRTKPGELLTPTWYDQKTINQEKEGMGTIEYGALHEQNPTVAGGTLFKNEWIEKHKTKEWPRVAHRWSVGVDTAGTEQADNPRADRTCCVAMCKLPNGKLFLSPMLAVRKSPARRNKDIRNLFTDLRALGVNAKWKIEPEKGVEAKKRTHSLGTDLMGARIDYVPPIGTKVERADPLRTQWELGNILLHDNEYTADFVDELLAFPHGPHDDWVDSAALAFSHHAIARFAARTSSAR